MKTTDICMNRTERMSFLVLFLSHLLSEGSSGVFVWNVADMYVCVWRFIWKTWTWNDLHLIWSFRIKTNKITIRRCMYLSGCLIANKIVFTFLKSRKISGVASCDIVNFRKQCPKLYWICIGKKRKEKRKKITTETSFLYIILAVVKFSCIFIIQILAFISAIFQYTAYAKQHRMTLTQQPQRSRSTDTIEWNGTCCTILLLFTTTTCTTCFWNDWLAPNCMRLNATKEENISINSGTR